MVILADPGAPGNVLENFAVARFWFVIRFGLERHQDRRVAVNLFASNHLHVVHREDFIGYRFFLTVLFGLLLQPLFLGLVLPFSQFLLDAFLLVTVLLLDVFLRQWNAVLRNVPAIGLPLL